VGKRNVHIANLRIRVPHGMADQATSLSRGLGSAILRKLAESTASETASRKLGEIAVTVHAGDHTHASIQQEQVAAQVARQLRIGGD